MQFEAYAWMVFHADNPAQQVLLSKEVLRRAEAIPLSLDNRTPDGGPYWGQLLIADAGNVTHFEIGVVDYDALPGTLKKLFDGLPVFPHDRIPQPYPHIELSD